MILYNNISSERSVFYRECAIVPRVKIKRKRSLMTYVRLYAKYTQLRDDLYEFGYSYYRFIRVNSVLNAVRDKLICMSVFTSNF